MGFWEDDAGEALGGKLLVELFIVGMRRVYDFADLGKGAFVREEFSGVVFEDPLGFGEAEVHSEGAPFVLMATDEQGWTRIGDWGPLPDGRGSEGWAGLGGAEAPRKLKLAPPELAARVLSDKEFNWLGDVILVALGEA